MDDVGSRVKEIRKKEGLSQREFARKIGISQALLSGIENGTEKFMERTRKIICFACGIEENWILHGQEPMCTPKKEPMIALHEINSVQLGLEEQELLKIYDKLIPETQKEVRSYAREKLELQELRVKTGKPAKKGGKSG